MSSHAVHRAVVMVIVALGLVAANPAIAVDDYASANAPSAGAMVMDAAIVRPLSLVATVLGTGAFLVALPFSLTGMNTAEADQRLVVEPLRYTFQRPLGDFEAQGPPTTD